ncbi:MAG: class I SAM-dependent methyltransferase [Patescibacteria group bacterium]|nr:class I SAM-dependent methyltransferase [Patescibacteria group bacterium]
MDQQKLWKMKWREAKIKPANTFARRSFSLISAKHKTLLDLGCGLGRDAMYFARKNLKVTAVDFSDTGLDKISRNIDNLTVVNQKIDNLKFKANSFDVIYTHLSLHYFDDQTTTQIFNKLYLISKQNGLIFIKCKSTDDDLFGKGKKIAPNMYYRNNHIRHFFTKEYMRDKLSKFEIIKIRKTSSVYHTYKSSFIEAVATKK